MRAEDYDFQKGRRLRRLSEVPRWCVVPTIRDQKTAEHSFQVAVVVRWLYLTQIAGLKTSDFLNHLMVAAIDHDDTEAVSGDVASPFKRVHGQSVKAWEKTMSPNHPPLTALCLKMADLIDAYMFVVEEEAMGNGRIKAIRIDIEEIVIKLWHDHKDQFLATDPYDLLAHARQAFDVTVHPGLESL